MNDSKDKVIYKLGMAVTLMGIIILCLLGVIGYLVMNGGLESSKVSADNQSSVAFECGTPTMDRAASKAFKMNCAACHKLTDQNLTGPGLAGLMDRIPSKEWLANFLLKEDSMVLAKDPYTLLIRSEYNVSEEMNHGNFTPKEQLADILKAFE